MKQSKLFSKTKKELSEDVEAASHKWLLKGDFIDQLSSGIYSFLPLGWRVHQKIENLIREEMNKIGAQEVFLPSLQPKQLWEETDRWGNMAPPLFKLEDQHEREYALGSTHEEVITDLARKRIESYRDLPQAVFQIQNKFRNEVRATGGLLRTREFMMKDLYSFHATEKSLDNYYQKVKKAYFRIFDSCNLNAVAVEAESGSIGGSKSEEFMIESPSGEDEVLICKNCNFGANTEKVGELNECPECGAELEHKNCIEEAHAFYLGDKYSSEMGATFTDKNGEEEPLLMGCYGIGVGRLMATIVEVSHDDKGIIWPMRVAPFQVHLLQLGDDKKVEKTAKKVTKSLQEAGIEVLYDDRDKSAGEKFADADLIGIPYRLVVSEKSLEEDSVEVKMRVEDETELISTGKIAEEIENRIK
ncbi:MAG: proline--tRNA ligase [Candidatus Paceibacterota bacterium]